MKKKWAVLPLAAALLLALSGCGSKAVSSDGLVGIWKDQSGLTEYQFEPDGEMRLKALTLGSFKGTYHVEGNKITLRYHILTQEVKDTYTIKVDGDSLFLDQSKYIRRG
ncbi:MAG: DUF5640 domain-containing protein [Thermocaproicibacter melissae]|jgi:hypothetical protein|uniref:DUF5640 domain-containing protein n=1 Tax=Thermocaproicibacter melissae TaxID=2966552 RepID=UPI003A101EC6